MKRINTPVLMTFFVRDYTFEKVLEQVRKVQPPVLFLVADGPRDGNHNDIDSLNKCKKLAENIDWDCEVHRVYSETNRGIHVNTYEGMKYAFERVDRLIFLEDDIYADESFFFYCDELLEKYKDDYRVQLINGMNHLEVYDKCETDYFFSKIGSIWGIAFWKRTFEAIENELKYLDDPYVVEKMMENLPRYLRKPYVVNALGRRKDYLKTGEIKSFELSLNSSKYLNNQIQIVPKKNLITSIGISSQSAHAPKELRMLPPAVRKLFFMKTYEMPFPMKEPVYCIPDLSYEKLVNRVRGNGYPLVTLYRYSYMGIMKLVTGDFKGAFQSLKRRLFSNKATKI